MVGLAVALGQLAVIVERGFVGRSYRSLNAKPEAGMY